MPEPELVTMMNRIAGLFAGGFLLSVPVLGIALEQAGAPTAAEPAVQMVTSHMPPDSSLSRPLPYSPGISDILKLVRAKVNDGVIKAYIQNSRVAYQPSADELIALSGQGVSGELLTAMLERGSQLRSGAAQPWSQAANVNDTGQPSNGPAPPVYVTQPDPDAPIYTTYSAPVYTDPEVYGSWNVWFGWGGYWPWAYWPYWSSSFTYCYPPYYPHHPPPPAGHPGGHPPGQPPPGGQPPGQPPGGQPPGQPPGAPGNSGGMRTEPGRPPARPPMTATAQSRPNSGQPASMASYSRGSQTPSSSVGAPRSFAAPAGRSEPNYAPQAGSRSVSTFSTGTRSFGNPMPMSRSFSSAPSGPRSMGSFNSSFSGGGRSVSIGASAPRGGGGFNGGGGGRRK